MVYNFYVKEHHFQLYHPQLKLGWIGVNFQFPSNLVLRWNRYEWSVGLTLLGFGAAWSKPRDFSKETKPLKERIASLVKHLNNFWR